MAKKRLSAEDFELAWVLRGRRWASDKEKALVRKCLVEGVDPKDVADDWRFTGPEYVGFNRLKNSIKETREQLFPAPMEYMSGYAHKRRIIVRDEIRSKIIDALWS